MDTATLTAIALLAARLTRMLADYNAGARDPAEIDAEWQALALSQEVTAALLREAAAAGGYADTAASTKTS